MGDTIRASVVVPTFNRATSLANCLAFLANQSVSDYEIIVVDDGSSSETKAVVEDALRTYTHRAIQYLREEKNSGCARARNVGIKKARGDIVLFTDDDCEVPSEWIATHLDAYQRFPEVSGVGGPYWPSAYESQHNGYERFYELYFEETFSRMRSFEVWTNTLHSPAGNTANMSYRRQFLIETGGFDEKLYFTGGVDYELKTRCIASGRSLLYIPLAVTHRKQFTLTTFISKSIKWGRGIDYHAKKFNTGGNLSLSTIAGMYALWTSSTITKGSHARYFLLWALCQWLGRWINIFTRFAPDTTHHLQNAGYFLNRYKNGKVITTHEMCRFVPQALSQSALETIPCISVIIPTFNRKELIQGAIRGVLNQNVPASTFELIVVDDGSTDGTKDVVDSLRAEYPDHKLVYVFQENRGAAHARNTGAERARGEILFFTDSDCTVPKHWLWTHLEAYRQHPEIVGTGGGMLTVRTDATLLDTFRNTGQDNRFVMRYRNVLIKTNDTTLIVTPFDSANMSVRTEAFKHVNGFYRVAVGSMAYHEDIDFALRIQLTEGKMALVPGAPAFNQRLLSLREFCDVAYVRGATLPALIKRCTPYITQVCRAHTRSFVGAYFIQSLLRPFDRLGWLRSIYFYYSSRGYQDTMMHSKEFYTSADTLE